MQFHILVFLEFLIAVNGVSLFETTVSVLIILILFETILYFSNFSLISFSFPKIFKIKSFFDLFLLKKI